MKTQDQVLCVLLGTTTFFAQILLEAAANFGGLAPRTAAIMMHGLNQIARDHTALLWTAFYVCVGILTHSLPLLVATKAIRDIELRGPAWGKQLVKQRGFLLLSATVFTAALIAWDRWLFPDTLVVVEGSLPYRPSDLTLLVVTSGAAAALLLAWLSSAATRRTIAIATCASAFLITASVIPAPAGGASNREKPDIILLGVDSLRPDHLAGRGARRSITPSIDAFVAEATSFENAYTPMGRTFVALMSTLSGRYPVNHDARENLFPRSGFSTESLLPYLLEDHGYKSIFSLDEARFANIDESFGFDYLVSPPSGVVELTSVVVASTAGVNLLQLLPGAHKALPHVAANRAAHRSYIPDLHVRRLTSAVRDVPADVPIFVLAHFTMPHTPYAYGPWRHEDLDSEYSDSPPGYRKSLAIVDRQIRATLTELERAGRLSNALVVLFSDHGEGLGMEKDRWRTESPAGTFLAQPSFGHGTQALDDAQARILLALQRFEDGRAVWPAAKPRVPASLVDITPTIVELLGLQPETISYDGVPLIADGLVTAPPDRPIFVESGIFGTSLKTLQVDAQSVANEFAHLYEVTPDLRVELKQEHLPQLLMVKQRGVILSGIGVATAPEKGCWSKVKLTNGVESCHEDPRHDPILASYSLLICNHFSSDRSFYHDWCTPERSL